MAINAAKTSLTKATYILGDTIQWLADLAPDSIHAVVTDPPYGLREYEDKDYKKLRSGRGGVWRIPPILCSPTRGVERNCTASVSKLQRFMRQIVRAALPLGIGIVYDRFAGSGSTLAAAESQGLHSIGTDRDPVRRRNVHICVDVIHAFDSVPVSLVDGLHAKLSGGVLPAPGNAVRRSPPVSASSW
ncbi:MAG: hypothetical protein HYX27_20860 [Acidobacteria bacterium]|nr:hypothetical protein [Acidobacteriota bacterium]